MVPGMMPLVCTALLVFHLYLAANWSRVQRPWAFCLGVAGLLLIFVAQLFVVGGARENDELWIVYNVFVDLGALVAFAGGLLAAYKGTYMANMIPGAQQQQPPQQPGAPSPSPTEPAEPQG
ncbi:MAG: hypothetical protein KGY99_01290 [Phycisphaerae bacterium]|nr:hypothetical protein [Phycisphaerae bacterium]